MHAEVTSVDSGRVYASFVRCLTCGYSLENLRGPEYRCPECGRAFDPADHRTWRSEAFASRSRPPWIIVVAMIAGGLLLIAACMAFIDSLWS